ncbi:YgjV family protein [Treponema sp.]|uniref:YgjV family protein n=1 Tax=Treponema sp. TaxID=166 RepID=UPI0025FC780D|nr:YgjV family protein [Treponema sp.]MCR5217168.1 YgjV family protein [Treponema sp.]
MDFKLILEIVGYIGSALVVVSMLMTSVVKLRLINLIGSVISIVYAAIVHAYPLAIMNFCLVVINVYNLYKLLNTKKEYSVVQVGADDSFAKFFINSFKSDIKSFFADFEDLSGSDSIHLVCCGTSPVGILAGTEKNDCLEVKIDYTIPMYRDCSVGKFIYSYLASKGVKSLKANASCPSHQAYLNKMGFKEKDSCLIKEL